MLTHATHLVLHQSQSDLLPTHTHRDDTNSTTVPTDSPTVPTDIAFIAGAAVVAFVVAVVILTAILMLARSIIRDKRKAAMRQREQETIARATERILQQGQRAPETQRISEPPVPANFNWHHSIRIDGSLPPSYADAAKLPPLNKTTVKKQRQTNKEGSQIPLLSDDDDVTHRSHEMSARSVSSTPHNTTVYGATRSL